MSHADEQSRLVVVDNPDLRDLLTSVPDALADPRIQWLPRRPRENTEAELWITDRGGRVELSRSPVEQDAEMALPVRGATRPVALVAGALASMMLSDANLTRCVLDLDGCHLEATVASARGDR